MLTTDHRLNNCLSCNKPLKGRTDKKFCDDYCRNAFNNHLKAADNNLLRNINNALRKNRRILSELLVDAQRAASRQAIKASREKLLELGFQFKYLTHTYTNPKGNVYHYCYEYGYLALANNWYLIVKWKEDQSLYRKFSHLPKDDRVESN